MKSIVIGGAGFIGSHMVDLLDQHGHEVVVVDNLSMGKVENVPDHVVKEYDIETITPEFLSILLEADFVFHFAALARVQPSIEKPIVFHKTNVNGLLNVLGVLRHNSKLQKFIFSSSSSVYGDQTTFPTSETAPKNPKSPYALQKLIGEQYVKLFAELYGVPCVSLRYFNVYGSRMLQEGAYSLVIGKWINLLKQGKPLQINGDGTQMRDFTYVGDVVEANLSVAIDENVDSGQAFNVGGEKPISVNEVADIFERVTKCERANFPPVIEPYKTHADISLIKKTFDWKPTMNFQEWLTNYIIGEMK
jgi:UDP-glucose 4-epimerase